MKVSWRYYLKYLILVISWMIVIWWLSDQPSVVIGLPSLGDLVVKKMGHLAGYAVLALMLFQALRGPQRWSGTTGRRHLFLIGGLTFLIGFIYACLDELHQLTVPGRSGSIGDVFIDSLGLIFGLVWAWRLYPQRLRHSLRVLLTK
ncbi:MAG: VanZ family protein [Candidatus Komeilibacteria bacterium]|nr:VanZ family protein [Candidatus Komeilibacteria bacterium]